MPLVQVQGELPGGCMHASFLIIDYVIKSFMSSFYRQSPYTSLSSSLHAEEQLGLQIHVFPHSSYIAIEVAIN